MSRPVSLASSPRSLAAASAPPRGQEAEPTGLARIKDHELRAAVTQAYLGWARRYAPHLLKELETE